MCCVIIRSLKKKRKKKKKKRKNGKNRNDGGYGSDIVDITKEAVSPLGPLCYQPNHRGTFAVLFRELKEMPHCLDSWDP